MQLVRACHKTIILSLMTASMAGCTAEIQRYVRFPNLEHPGPAGYQRADAIQHDPYPLDDVGPEIVGGRPLAYQRPVNEVERARMPPSLTGVIQAVPAPAVQVTAPPVLGAPYPAAPAPIATPYPVGPPPVVTAPVPVGPAPVVTSPYPAAAPQGAPFPYQQRAPY